MKVPTATLGFKSQLPPTTDRREPGLHKIVLVCDWYLPRIGGIERHLAQLATRLAAAGLDVTIVTPMPGARSSDPRVRLASVDAALLPGAKLMWTPAGFRNLGRLIRAGEFDLVHVHSSIISPAAFAALYQARKAGLPALVTMHSLLGRFRPVFAGWDRLIRWSRWPVVYSGVSARVARELRSLVPSRPVIVLPNAVDPAEWRTPPIRPIDCVAIATVMRLVPRKRGAVLIRAMRRACTELGPNRPIRLQIAGDGPERRQLEALAGSLGLTDSVHFLGAVSPAQVKALLATSHFFVLPSLLEAFGIAALEARAAGLPVVAMRESGVQEFIVHGEDGLLADSDDQFAAHVVKLCSDTSLRERIAAHNRATPVACTWDRVLGMHLAAYEKARESAAARND